MIVVNGKHKIPSQWEELSPSQFINVVTALLELKMEQLDFIQFRTTLVFLLLGERTEDPSNEILCENVFRLAETLTFPYQYVYNDPRFAKLSPSLQEQLRKTLPASMDASEPEVRVAQTFNYSIAPDLLMKKQLIPSLPEGMIQGYRFSYAGQMADTTLTARQYVEANSLVSLMEDNSEDTDMVLDAMLGVLYPSPENRYTNVPFQTKMAVLYNYIGIAEWVSRIPKYDLIFNRADGKRSSSPLGQENSLLTIAEKGYGDYEAVCRMNLFTYLDILLKQTVDTILEMKAYKTKASEIATKLNLTIEQVNSIL